MTDSLENQPQQDAPMKPEKGKAESQASISMPYMFGYGSITKALEKIQSAATPERFTTDFLSTKLNMKGGTPRPVIPFLKKTGFLNGDGTPTDIYREFRNPSLRGNAAAKALKKGYAPLYEINEYVHDLSDRELEGVIAQSTGLDAKSKTLRVIVGSFKALKSFAQFDGEDSIQSHAEEPEGSGQEPNYHPDTQTPKPPIGLNLGYVINLNLPATSDVAVFDAIFKSLRKNILE